MKNNLKCIICSAVLLTSTVFYPITKSLLQVQAEEGFDPKVIVSSIGTTSKYDSACKQIVEVIGNGSSAKVNTYELSNGKWNLLKTYNGYVGSGGVGTAKEGSSITPTGIYYLGFGFGNKEASGTKIEYRYINGNKNIYWVSDPASPLYNRWVETDKVTWNSSKDEDLAKIGSVYNYAVVIEYNMHPITQGDKGSNAPGSAFFLHCSSGKATAGCVSIPEDNMLEVLKWLDPDKKPMILMYKE